MADEWIQPREQPPLEEKVNILLVDDQPHGLFALEAVLASLGQNLVKARSGREALRTPARPAISPSSCSTCRCPAWTATRPPTSSASAAFRAHTPIIFLTASQKADTQVIRGYAVGAVDYLFKPFDARRPPLEGPVFVELAKKTALITRQTAEPIRREQEARELAESRAHLVTEIEHKNRQLEAANRDLETFSYSVSHDLRAPLRSIEGFSQALIDDHLAALDEDGQHCLRHVRDAARHMSELIDGLLALSRVTRSELRRERVDLSRLAREVVDRLRHRDPGTQREVEFAIEEGLTTDGDPRLLLVVLENLLGNAWKFTSKQPHARIELGSTRQDAQRAFLVRDNGAGFDMAYANKLFRAFQRLHATSEFEGHGIGLATVEQVLRRHGGRVWAEGKPGAGATFYFTVGEKMRERE